VGRLRPQEKDWNDDLCAKRGGPGLTLDAFFRGGGRHAPGGGVSSCGLFCPDSKGPCKSRNAPWEGIFALFFREERLRCLTGP